MTRAEYYSKYLRSKGWKARREEVLDRTSTTKGGEKRCHICLEHNLLHIHHLTYDRVGEEDKKDLVALCPSCHKTFHSYAKSLGIKLKDRERNRKLLRALRRTGHHKDKICDQDLRKKRVIEILTEIGGLPKVSPNIVLRKSNGQTKKLFYGNLQAPG